MSQEGQREPGELLPPAPKTCRNHLFGVPPHLTGQEGDTVGQGVTLWGGG